MKAIIFGGGPTKALIDTVPKDIFTVSCNMYFPNANIIFARDECTLEKITKEKLKEFEKQLVFTTPREYENYFDSGRVMLIDEDKLWPRSQGLSTGILAIGTLLRFGFEKIYLCGFTFENPSGSLEKLLTVTSKLDKLYCIVEEPLLLDPPVPNFITKEVFYKNETKN